MQITFGEAFEAGVLVAQAIPAGYIVSLLPEGAEPAQRIDRNDIELISVDLDGVRGRAIDPDTEEPTRREVFRDWESIDRIHVH